MPNRLSATLREMRATSLVRQAETIRDYPAGPERIVEAETYIREAMLQCILGNITQEDKYRVFSILHFAMPSDAPSAQEHPPVNPDDNPPAEPEEQIPFDAACFLGCPACDEGGRMVDD